jgi:formate-dependent nitrite reductase membrane component NrfD
VQGPVIKAPVWTWEVPLYFWFGGVAAGSSFVALACDLAGDHRAAVVARRVAIAAVVPSPPLLILDLGRPARFLNMLRILKPRSPMNLGAWCLAAFSAVGAGAVAADVLGRPRAARTLGGVNAVLGGYLGSYTGVLLATTAVPVWGRSRMFLGPVFVATATAGGAAATRLALVAGGSVPAGHPTRTALGNVEMGAMLAELALSKLNERRLGRLGEAFETGRAGVLFRSAEAAVLTGLGLRLVRARLGRGAHDVASVLYLAAGLAFRYAWIEAGKVSAADHEAVARTARGQATVDDRTERLRRRTRYAPTRMLRPTGRLARAAAGYAEGVRRASLAVEGAALRAGWRPGRGH